MKNFSLPLFILVLYSCNEPNPKVSPSPNTPLFKLLQSTETGIDFVNQVIDKEGFNILSYRNFYNGGGVAIGDINNDSLPDIYFTSNQNKNKLYLNKGDMKFEDITITAGVSGTRRWSTGVNMADVNGDGLLDIYVCNSGDVDGEEKENELFINNGDLTFTDKAKAYNLNNEGYSTHAAFFDYDQDGDLDCYILNNSFKDPSKIELYRKVREEEYDEGGDKLMRNDGNTFTDVTKEAGIFSSNIGFGLGVAVGDLNSDHLPDIYISNDFWERDYLYINKGSGVFSEELIDRINYCSVSSMGADIADINNDGSPEIFTTDMLSADNYRIKSSMMFDPYHLEDLKYRSNFHYQMIQNCLHLNDGNANFQEIGLLSNVAATDWSWGALLFDFENDGNKDIFVSNGIAKDLMYMDFVDFKANTTTKSDASDSGKSTDLKMIEMMPSTPIKNFAFQNTGNLKFNDQAEKLGLAQPSFSNGSAYGDLDNDGDLDLVINNVNSPSFIYRNDANKLNQNHFLKVDFKGYAQNPFGIGAQVKIKTGDEIRVLENFNNRGFESSIEPKLLFGLGSISNIELLEVVWPDGKTELISNLKPDQTITLDYANAETVTNQARSSNSYFKEISQTAIKGRAQHVENRYNDFDHEILLPRMLSTEGPELIVGDVNNDQLDDFILLGAFNDPDKLFIQNADGSFSSKVSPDLSKDAGFESTSGALFDHDKDGDLDLMIASGGNEYQRDRLNFIVRLYKNDGRGNFTIDPLSIPQVIGNFSTLEAEDLDKDGDIDIFLGARAVPGNYGLQPQSYLLRNERGSWVNIAPASLGDVGMVTDATWEDIDADGDKDLIVVGDWMSINIFINENGLIKEKRVIPNSSGWWNCIVSSDLDGDGDMDFVLGNWGLNSKFKASPNTPVTMSVNDFDANGKSEFIINWYPPLNDQPYPFATKSDLTTQLPGLKKKILKYEKYAHMSYDSLFSNEMKRSAINYQVNYLESAVLWNDGDSSFTLKALSVEAQVSPVFAIVANDLDDDRNTDIWLGGNFYALKPQVGRHDASKGVYLKGNGNKSFEFIPQRTDGLYVNGEVRDAVVILSNDSQKLIVARNNASVLVFQHNK